VPALSLAGAARRWGARELRRWDDELAATNFLSPWGSPAVALLVVRAAPPSMYISTMESRNHLHPIYEARNMYT
jgi:hypothetical protein